MKKTTNYQLNQWEKSDRIQMEDFNSDNMKVEQVLAAQAEALNAAVRELSKSPFVIGVLSNYTGKTDVTVDLGQQPRMVMVGSRLGWTNVITTTSTSTRCGHAVALPGYPCYKCSISSDAPSGTISLKVTNTGFTVYSGLSSELAPYYYLAIL